MKLAIIGINFVRIHLNIHKMKSTYQKSAIGLLILLLTSISGCEKELLPITACGVDDPAKNLPWLQSMLYDISAVALPEIERVDLFTYNSKEIIRISWTNYYQLYDAPTGSVYDCNGTRLYICGGNQPVDSCSIVTNKSQYIGRIWERE